MKGWHLACAEILVLVTSHSWGQSTIPRITYSEKEYTSLLACQGMTDAAWMGARQKLNGVTLADANKVYDGLEAAQKNLTLHILDKVYGDSFTNAGDYAVSFFSECSENIANIGQDRSRPARYCMQNSMIGMTAWAYRNAGQPKENVYQVFAKFDAVPEPRSIIDRVYAGSKSRAELALDEYQSCMQPLISKSSPQPVVAPTISAVQSSSAPPPPPQTIPPLGGLTDKEFAAMPPCVVIAVSVWGIVENKQQGTRLDDMKKQYQSTSDPQMKAFMLSVVDKVYADRVAAPGLYSIRYLDSCAQQKAGVAPIRMGVANSCLKNGYIEAKASAFKKSGASSDKAYEPFAEIYGTQASTIVDKVYRSPDSNEGLGVAEWKACVISSPTWTTNQKGQEVVIAATPSGYQAGVETKFETKTDKGVVKSFYLTGESPHHWTERLTLSAFFGLNDHTPSAFQKAIQGPSENCKDGKVTSSSVGEDDGYAFAFWSETCAGSAGKSEFRFHKAIQGHDNFYVISKSFQFEPSEAQTQQSRSYLSSVKVCDSTRNGQPCPSTDAWRP